MKNAFLFLLALLFLTGCVKQEPIPQSALTGIWKLNGYQSSNYQVEITNDGYLYWWNYDDIFNNVQEFELEYDINNNRVRLYRSNGTYSDCGSLPCIPTAKWTPLFLRTGYRHQM
jgi:hypothetical protein